MHGDKLKKILFIDTYYQWVLNQVEQDNHLDSFSTCVEVLEKLRFGTASSLDHEFNLVGWESRFVVPNFFPMQNLWRIENGFSKSYRFGWRSSRYFSKVPGLSKFVFILPYVQKTLFEQIKKFHPDYVYIHDLNLLSPNVLRQIKKLNIKLLGEIASPLPSKKILKEYEFIFTASIPILQRLKEEKIPCDLLPLAFDSRNWEDNKKFNRERDTDVIFIGTVSKLHKKTLPLIIELAKEIKNFKVYGPSSTRQALEKVSLESIYYGKAWGPQMFKLLATSKICINRHGEIAEGYATNMRMYESTGMGSLLLTDAKKDLNRLFIEGEEVLTYSDPIDAVNKIKWLLKNPKFIKDISSRGQSKTLRQHTYKIRALQLIEKLEKI